MRVVTVERNVAKQRQSQCSADDAGIDNTRQTAAQMERQAQRERENQQHCCAPCAKIKRIGDRLVDRAERRRRAQTERKEKQRGFEQ